MTESKSLFAFLYRTRCRLGAWLLKPHVTALIIHYDNMAVAHGLKGIAEQKKSCEYIEIGLRYAVGQSMPWRRADDLQSLYARETRAMMEHAKDPL